MTDFCTRQYVIPNTDYQRRATSEYDESGKRRFSYVIRITNDSENNIYVIDRVNDEGHGRVVGLDMNGRKRFIYNGHNIINTQDAPFTPTDIVVTSTNKFLIA